MDAREADFHCRGTMPAQRGCGEVQDGIGKKLDSRLLSG